VENLLQSVDPREMRKSFQVVRYTAACRQAWDAFVSTGKNATFLFYRDYMEYHRDRFVDHSLMVYDGEKLVALLPANLNADDTLISHEGLTYGGLVVARSATLMEVASCFHAVLHYLHEQKIVRLLYKRLPGFYNVLPDDETAYVLFLLAARLWRRDIALVVPQGSRLPFQRRRLREIKTANKLGMRVLPETNFRPFWEQVLTPRLLGRYGVRPVHTVDEITLLATRFPQCIKQFSAYCGDRILAGATIFETPSVAHAQYCGVTDQGAKSGALDFLFGWLIQEQYRDKRYFDFGICNECEGCTVNHGLLDWKEGFGARCYAHDFYEVATEQFIRLEPVLQAGDQHHYDKGKA
jgi:hypothetical protein